MHVITFLFNVYSGHSSETQIHLNRVFLQMQIYLECR